MYCGIQNSKWVEHTTNMFHFQPILISTNLIYNQYFNAALERGFISKAFIWNLH